MRARALLAAILLVAACVPRGEGALPALIRESESFLQPLEAGGQLVMVPDIALAGVLINATFADKEEECGAACWEDPSCEWFNFCERQAGCGGAYPMEAFACELLASAPPPPGNTSDGLPRIAAQGSGIDVIGGFPVRPQTLPELPSFTAVPAQGVVAEPLRCPGSLLPDACATRNLLDAGIVCVQNPACRTITVFQQGFDGLPGPIAYLSGSSTASPSTFVAPSVYALSHFTSAAEPDVFGDILFASDAYLETTVVMAANGTSNSSAGSSAGGYKGCVIAQHAVIRGSVVLHGSANKQADAEACCRSCASYEPPPGGLACDGWRYCSVPTGCSFYWAGGNETLALAQGECELVSQPTVNATSGWPPVMAGKGPNVSFTTGFPMLVSQTPPVPGYTLLPGRGVYRADYLCPDTLKSMIGACILPGTLAASAKYCSADPTCAAFVFREGMLYVKDQAPGSSGLSAGAIAGIAVGAAAGAAALLAAAGLLVRRRVRARPSVLDDAGGGKEVRAAGAGGSGGSPAPGSSLSPQPGSRGSREAGDAAEEGGLEKSASWAMDLRTSSVSGAGSTDSFSLEALPAELRRWVVDPAAITYLHDAEGRVQELGAGSGGRVLKADLHGEIVAVKEVQLSRSAGARKAFVTEAVRLYSLRHPQIVGFIGVALPGPPSNSGLLIMEFCEGRDLGTMLGLHTMTEPGASPGSGAGERVFAWRRRGRQVALDIVRAVNHLHAHSIVHLDIKSSNVLLSMRGGAKLADVGLSRVQHGTFLSSLPGMVGTFSWMRAPEVPTECPQEVADLIKRCTAIDPTSRPTAKEVMQELQQLSRAGRSAASVSAGSPPPALRAALPAVAPPPPGGAAMPDGSAGPSALRSGPSA
eukprot:scaffold9.g3134.t1